MRIDLTLADRSTTSVVFRTALANDLGHDRRADRAAAMILDFDTFGLIDRHARPLDLGAVDREGTLLPLPAARELYVLTSYAPGTPYACDLRDIAARRAASRGDLRRAEILAEYLASLHSEQLVSAALYRRAIRDLVGSGEGIFGVIDAYPADTPSASSARLQRIETNVVSWRRRLAQRTERLVRTHGDFHPFNILFTADDELSLLDASRGCSGDAADDATALALNYAFFAADVPDLWRTAFRSLWNTFWSRYQERRFDPDLLTVAPPFLAWRALVVCNPRFYPALSPLGRDRILGMAERALEQQRLSLDLPDDFLR